MTVFDIDNENAVEQLHNSDDMQESHPEYIEVIAAVANHEAKALTFLNLWTEGNYLTLSQQHNTLLKKYAGQEAWQIAMPGPFQYCETTLEPIGYLVKGSVKTVSGIKPAFAVNERGRELGVPLVGYILDWSLRYPDISIQDLFGSTKTSGDTRAPQTRIRILEEAITNPHLSALAATDVVEIDIENGASSPEWIRKTGRVIASLRALKSAGIVEVTNVLDSDDRTVTIVNPVPPKEGHPRNEISDAIYEYIGEQWQLGETIIDFTVALDGIAEVIRRKGQPANLTLIRSKLTHAINDMEEFVGIKGAVTFNKGKMTKITLKDEYREGITELLEIIHSFENGFTTEQKQIGTELATKIMATPEAVAELMNKAERFSPMTRGISPGELKSKVEAILKDAQGNGLTKNDVMAVVQKQTGKSVGLRTIERALTSLTKERKVNVGYESSHRTNGIQKKANIYTFRPG